MVSARIKELIRYCNISNKEFSNKIGVQPNALSNYLNNRRSLSIEIVLKIHKFTNCDLAWLLTGEGEMFLTEKKLDDDSSNYINEIERLKKEIQEIEVNLQQVTAKKKQTETENKTLSADLREKAERIISLQDKLLELKGV
jgi:transcriptional regulator with XRE-family HTH domain